LYHDAPWLDIAGRLLIVFFFLATGVCNLTRERINDHIDRMASLHTPFPRTLFWIGIALQFSGCTLILADWHAAVGVACLIFFTVSATAIFHRFWSKRDPIQRNFSRLTMLGNSAILGGLFLLLEKVR
jgi:uncharacterized membrane protein YphA (DoxX/SURF4 family)